MEYRRVAVIIEDLTFRGRCISCEVRNGVIHNAVPFFAFYLGGNIAVVIVGGGKAFLLIFVVRKGVVVIDVLQLDHRGRRIDDLYRSRVGRAHPKILSRVCDDILSGLMNVDALGGNGDRNRVVDEIQDRPGDFCLGPFILIGRAAFADDGGFADQPKVNPPFVDAE